MISSNIKNLAIACEALSRINGMESQLLTVRHLLDDELGKATMEKYDNSTCTQPPRTPTLDEEIPF